MSEDHNNHGDFDCPDCQAEAEEGFCCETHCADCIDEAAFGPRPPVITNHDDDENGWSCPHCKAGYEYTPSIGQVRRIHEDENCPEWNKGWALAEK